MVGLPVRFSPRTPGLTTAALSATRGKRGLILASDWSRQITWPGYWPLISRQISVSRVRSKLGLINYWQQTTNVFMATERKMYILTWQKFNFDILSKTDQFQFIIYRIQSAKTKNNKWTSKTFKNMRNWQNRWNISRTWSMVWLCHFQRLWEPRSQQHWGNQTEETTHTGQLRETHAR